MLLSQIGSAGGSVTFYYDYGSFQEVSVNAAGNSADMAMPGVQFQFVSKSGGNNLRGSVLLNYENESIQSYNIDSALLARGVASKDDNRLHQFYDRNADVGGPVKRDRLWWYTSFRDRTLAGTLCEFPRATVRDPPDQLHRQADRPAVAERQVDRLRSERARNCSRTARTPRRSAGRAGHAASGCSTTKTPPPTRTTLAGYGKANTTVSCRAARWRKSAPVASATPGTRASTRMKYAGRISAAASSPVAT